MDAGKYDDTDASKDDSPPLNVANPVVMQHVTHQVIIDFVNEIKEEFSSKIIRDKKVFKLQLN